MLDAETLIEKHQGKGALVDANLLVLFLVGAINKQRILSFKRTQDFTIQDFELLARLIDWFGKIFATHHVLSQASDLADLSGREGRSANCSSWLSSRSKNPTIQAACLLPILFLSVWD